MGADVGGSFYKKRGAEGWVDAQLERAVDR
jgi:hypothetical protein